MKKTLAAAGVLCLLSGALWAEDFYSSFKIGIQATATPITTLYSVSSDYTDGAMMYPQITLGAALHLFPWLELCPGVTFSETENTYEDVYNNGSPYVKSRMEFYGGGADLLVFLGRGPLSFIVGSGFWYGWGADRNLVASGSVSSEDEYSSMMIPVILGVQFLMNRNFGFYLRTGVDIYISTYRYSSYNTTLGAMTSGTLYDETYTLIHNPTFGLIYYFN